MSDDQFDDGLVHSHAWATEPPAAPVVIVQVADTRHLPTPSTVHQDEHVHPC